MVHYTVYNIGKQKIRAALGSGAVLRVTYYYIDAREVNDSARADLCRHRSRSLIIII